MSDRDPDAGTTFGSVEEGATRRASLSTIRHDLRTPINAIIGYSELLLEEADESAQADFVSDLRKIHAAGTELLSLVNELLDPAKIEATPLDDDLEAVATGLNQATRTPINAVLALCEKLLKAAAADREAPVLDLRRIHAAATRFASLTGEIVQGQAPRDAEGGEAATPATGPATAAEATTPDAVTGIGSQAEEPMESASANDGPVLVVDDNVINRDILARWLKREGLRAVVATNGRQALELLAAETFDLVLLDILMPEMDGIQVLQHLKAYARLREIPVVMISALDEIESVVRCLELGADDYLPKPFNPAILKARIGASLEKKRLRDRVAAYRRQINLFTAAAAEIEAGEFDPESLTEAATRRDDLGQLARGLQRMAREVAAREERLKQQVRTLRIEIEGGTKAGAVTERTETE